ncbi:transporter [Sinorhizobium meliloti WSM1022]|jgi:long-chain fatty acid transport protein|uniref:OmpP1/FadL family transporter n=1 Tax=Rhizobium meliloti TaxID=382 RepID=UPI0004236DFF|nr:OmpP1/FadL family transporter [Sinorhizobium meliloti]ASQ04184.1 transporter [Sinorhizobium meliloti]MCO6422932.1 OmpP1/FadL family transporter [Sinorhizobium meliloti]MDW9409682.1 transporter [Sinorhizobium meliloti]MDW9441097.1 transporter [Sinorhizobium meliloti]MDW9454856.1 transporter [Sinorhizobium meliloti]
MARIGLKQGILAAVAGMLVASAAQAGGLERSGYNIDLLFDPSDYAAEATATYVNPQRDLKNVTDINPANGIGSNGIGGGSTSVRDTESYWAPRIGVKAGLGDSIDCMADYSQPWGAHTNPGKNWMGANDNIETKVESDNYAATCSYKWEMGPGVVRIIGGGFYQEVGGFKDRLVAPAIAVAPLSGVGRLELEGEGWGWRTGIAYEIPEYAMRASLVYNSKVDLDDLSGFIDLTQFAFPVPGAPIRGTKYDVSGSASMPDSLELKVQSGIAPGWLAFGSVKWTDWSQLQVLRFCPATASVLTPCTSLDLLYRDGWTVSGGIGHKFTDQWSGAVSLTWDRGTSHGYGSQTDTWLLGTGVSYTPTENVELRLAGSVGILTSGSSGPVTVNGETIGNEVTYDFGNDFVGAISTSLKVRF